jgi:cytochrome P450
MTASFAFDPFATWADPYPIYRRLRDEAPVHHNDERRVWSVTRFDDVMHVLKSPELFSSRAMFTMLMAGGSERIRITWQTIPLLWKLIWKLRMNPLEFHTARNRSPRTASATRRCARS